MNEMIVSFVLGLLIEILGLLTERAVFIGRLYESFGGIIVGFFGKTLQGLSKNRICFSSIALSSIIWLLPGLSLTISITELATRNMVSGTSRIFFSLIIALSLGFGLAVGSRSAIYLLGDIIDTESCSPLPFWTNVFFFIGISISFAILLDASPSQWFGMIICDAVAYVVYTIIDLFFGSDASSAIAAFSVGVVGSLLPRIFGGIGMVNVLAGILMLVPGSIGVRGVSSMFANDVVSGIQFGFQMLVIGLSITVGLFFANMLVYPRKVFAMRPDNLVF